MTQTPELKRDLVLAPGEYAYLQDETRGQIKTHVGPTVINQTAQDRPVVYDAHTQTFRRCKLEEAVMKSPLASEGDYIVLENPAEAERGQNAFPEEGNAKAAPPLKVGRKVNIPGPCNFALWPGQRAVVVKGHHLRSNQYLLVRVYNEQEARNNWNSAVAVLTAGVAATIPAGQVTPVTTNAEQLGLTIGKLLVIKGTEVSFYIPPTGVEVVPEEINRFVRDAVTLERLEYSILIEEDGNKRYSIGPQVVFPKPTEAFFTEQDANGISVRKFKAIELNNIQGLHIKVIADYAEGDESPEVGEELFITGADTPIYYPRVEHSIIQYGDKKKHYATAIPNAGEGRYLMNRSTGEIKTVKGPSMLLPDPREQVIVRRILSDKQVDLWYPGNEEAKNYNRNLRVLATATPSARSGFVSEGDVSAQNVRNRKGPAFPGHQLINAGNVSATANLSQLDYSEFSQVLTSAAPSPVGKAVTPDMFERGTSYTQPRTVTIDTKYEGVPSITVWTGYAVMVVSKTGNRRVVKGPTTFLLDYDESLEVLELSTGKPKTTDTLQKTVYLRVLNNKVSDVVNVRTKDKVEVRLRLSYRVNFEGEPGRWFDVENYVKFMCDHCRSVLKGAAQKLKVEDFDNKGVDIVREALLGPATPEGNRVGMAFEENGMRVVDVEVLGIEVVDPAIAKMLNDAQHEVVRSNIVLHQAEKHLEVTKRQEEIARETEGCKTETTKRRSELASELSQQQQTIKLAAIKNELEAAEQLRVTEIKKEEVKEVGAKALLARKQAELDQQIDTQKKMSLLKIAEEDANTAAAVARYNAAQGSLSEALVAVSSQETLTKMATALSAQSMLGGKDLVEVVQKIFAGSPLDAIMSKVAERAGVVTPTNTDNTPRRR